MSAYQFPPPISAPDDFAEWLLGTCEFFGLQDDAAGGTIQLWTLRKDWPGLMVKSTYTRSTLERAFRRK